MKGLNPNDKIEDLYIESPPSKSVLPGLETLSASDPKQEGSAVQRPLHAASHFHYSRNPQLAAETHGLQTRDEAVQAAHAESASSAYSEHRQSNESGSHHRRRNRSSEAESFQPR